MMNPEQHQTSVLRTKSRGIQTLLKEDTAKTMQVKLVEELEKFNTQRVMSDAMRKHSLVLHEELRVLERYLDKKRDRARKLISRSSFDRVEWHLYDDASLDDLHRKAEKICEYCIKEKRVRRGEPNLPTAPPQERITNAITANVNEGHQSPLSRPPPPASEHSYTTPPPVVGETIAGSATDSLSWLRKKLW